MSDLTLNQHKGPPVPPQELVEQWFEEVYGYALAPGDTTTRVAAKAAAWGYQEAMATITEREQATADAELEAMLVELKAMHLPDGYADCLRAAIALAISRRAPAQAAEGDRQPTGYAYRYQQFGYSVIRFNGGTEVNSSRPTEPIPYWLGEPPQPAPPTEGEVGDEELESVARAAEVQNMKEQGGLHANDANGISEQMRVNRVAGLRSVYALARSRRAPVQAADGEVSQ